MDLMLFDDAAALAPPRVLREDLPGGGFIMRSPELLQPFVRCIGEWLEHWAQTTPDAVFLAERDAAGGWRQLTYRQTRDAVGRLAQAQLDLNLPADKPVVILSDNSVVHTLMRGMASASASVRGSTRRKPWGMPITRMASSSSVTRITPIWAVMDEPDRPATRMAASMGPSSRINEMPRILTMNDSAPNWRSCRLIR